jgi:hypothetical protein
MACAALHMCLGMLCMRTNWGLSGCLHLWLFSCGVNVCTGSNGLVWFLSPQHTCWPVCMYVILLGGVFVELVGAVPCCWLHGLIVHAASGVCKSGHAHCAFASSMPRCWQQACCTCKSNGLRRHCLT